MPYDPIFWLFIFILLVNDLLNVFQNAHTLLYLVILGILQIV